MRPLLRVGSVLLGSVLLAADARAFVVSGNITDSAGTPIHNIKVDILDEDPGFDDPLASVYTNALGNYSATITSGWGVENPDLYLSVEWKFPLLPATDYGGHHVVVLGIATFNAGPPATYTSTTQFTSKTGPVLTDHDPATNPPPQNLAMNEALTLVGAATLVDDVETLRLHINESLDYYRQNKGGVTWSWNEDVPAHIIANDITSFFSSSVMFAGEPAVTINICQDDINGAALAVLGGGFVSDIYHEMGHYVHYRFNGDALPTSAVSGAHAFNFESDPPFALIEGWPSYLAEITDNLHVNDGKYSTGLDDGSTPGFAANSLWRGDEMPAAKRTGRDTGGFESGERVEGALEGVWNTIHNDPLFSAAPVGTGFPANFGVMVARKPNDIFQFRDGFVSQFGSGTAETKRLYAILQQHGIVYARARFAPDPFAGPHPAGAAKDVNGVLFLRGTVRTKLEAVSAADLGVVTRVDIDKVSLFWKAANDLLTDAPGSFPIGFGPFSFASAIDFDTAVVGDGAWEFLLQGENEHGFPDSFLPTWGPIAGGATPDPGDANTAVNTDEKYLKVLGAWYDKDRNPATDAVAEGKVAIDNTAPTVGVAVKKTR